MPPRVAVEAVYRDSQHLQKVDPSQVRDRLEDLLGSGTTVARVYTTPTEMPAHRDMTSQGDPTGLVVELGEDSVSHPTLNAVIRAVKRPNGVGFFSRGPVEIRIRAKEGPDTLR